MYEVISNEHMHMCNKIYKANMHKLYGRHFLKISFVKIFQFEHSVYRD